uniref:Uncharacterized protein n=1 Tax=Ditylenchus dipsaci TaxID=166011 RepID=A0A915E6T8_9BILA
MSLKYFLLIAVLAVGLVNADLNTDNDSFNRHFQARRNRQHNSRLGFESLTEPATDFAGSAIETASLNAGAKCYDSRLTNIINTGIQHYNHDMGALTKYILDQINRAHIGELGLASNGKVSPMVTCSRLTALMGATIMTPKLT